MTVDQRFLEFAANHKLAALATIRRSGLPQLSNVNYCIEGDLVRISLTDNRAKVANMRRDPRATLFVSSPDGWAYAALDCDVDLSAVAGDPHDAAVEELIEVYRLAAGKDHPDWDEYRAAMVADKRLVGRLRVNHTYGMV